MQVPQPGETFEGKYEIVRRLGSGGFANVFLAIDLEIQREVAIKVLTPEGNGYRRGVEARFMTEARILAELQNPHTIRLFTYGQTTEGLLYMVFQYVAGTDLSVVLTERGRLPEPVAVHIAMQVLDALTEAHAAGVLHRDLKPANVLVYQHMGDEFAVKLLDFGIAKVDPRAGGQNLTKTGAVVGTPRYMAPEQVFGEPFGPSADVYSVGLVLYEMVTGRHAVEGDHAAILRHHVTEMDHRVPPGVVRRSVAVVLERMLAREPQDRIQTAHEAKNALARALMSDSAANAPPPSGPIHTGAQFRPSPTTLDEPPPSRKRQLTVFFASAAIAVVAGLGGWYWNSRPKPKPKPEEPVKVGAEVRAELFTVTEREPKPEEPEIATPDVGVDAGTDAGVDAGAVEPYVTGCGKISKGGQVSVGVGFGRSASVWLPEDYDPERRYPVMLTFHPRLINENGYFKDARFITGVRRGWIVVGVPASDMLDSWESKVDLDVARSALFEARRRYCVDDKRVFAAGHAEGAEMARRYACAFPTSGLLISGWALKLDEPWCRQESQPVPTMWVIGQKDEHIPEDGGYGCNKGPYMSWDMFRDVLRKTNGCKDERKEYRKEKLYTCDIWDQCGEGAFAQCVSQGGHNLDRSGVYLLANPGCSRASLSFDFENAFKFFEEHGAELPLPEGSTQN